MNHLLLANTFEGCPLSNYKEMTNTVDSRGPLTKNNVLYIKYAVYTYQKERNDFYPQSVLYRVSETKSSSSHVYRHIAILYDAPIAAGVPVRVLRLRTFFNYSECLRYPGTYLALDHRWFCKACLVLYCTGSIQAYVCRFDRMNIESLDSICHCVFQNNSTNSDHVKDILALKSSWVRTKNAVHTVCTLQSRFIKDSSRWYLYRRPEYDAYRSRYVGKKRKEEFGEQRWFVSTCVL